MAAQRLFLIEWSQQQDVKHAKARLVERSGLAKNKGLNEAT